MNRDQLFRTTTSAALALFAALLLPAGSANALPLFTGPSAYLNASDSPFSPGSFSCFHIENFEDGALNTPGVTASPGWSVIDPIVFTDSVDADDGAIDGQGSAGRSFYSNGTNASATFTFDAAALGRSLPTHVGIVWTDVGFAGPVTGFGNVLFSALRANGISPGSVGPFLLGDGIATGSTGEDRFFGVIDLDGISQFTISMSDSTDWEVDHLQYGFQPTAVPEPGQLFLLVAGTGCLLIKRRLMKR